MMSRFGYLLNSSCWWWVGCVLFFTLGYSTKSFIHSCEFDQEYAEFDHKYGPMRRFLRAPPKSGSTYAMTVLATSIILLVENSRNNVTTRVVEWTDYPSHDKLENCSRNVNIFPCHKSFCAMSLKPNFGHGGQIGSEQFCSKQKGVNKSIPWGMPHIVGARTVFLCRHPLSLLAAQHVWFKGNETTFSFKKMLFTCIMNYYEAWQAASDDHGDDVLIIRYEDLIKNPVSTLKKIFEFWKLPIVLSIFQRASMQTTRQKMWEIENKFYHDKPSRWWYTRPKKSSVGRVSFSHSDFQFIRKVFEDSKFSKRQGYTAANCNLSVCHRSGVAIVQSSHDI